MLKQALITSALLLGSTSQLSASKCGTYTSNSRDDIDFSFYVDPADFFFADL